MVKMDFSVSNGSGGEQRQSESLDVDARINDTNRNLARRARLKFMNQVWSDIAENGLSSARNRTTALDLLYFKYNGLVNDTLYGINVLEDSGLVSCRAFVDNLKEIRFGSNGAEQSNKDYWLNLREVARRLTSNKPTTPKSRLEKDIEYTLKDSDVALSVWELIRVEEPKNKWMADESLLELNNEDNDYFLSSATELNNQIDAIENRITFRNRVEKYLAREGNKDDNILINGLETIYAYCGKEDVDRVIKGYYSNRTYLDEVIADLERYKTFALSVESLRNCELLKQKNAKKDGNLEAVNPLVDVVEDNDTHQQVNQINEFTFLERDFFGQGDDKEYVTALAELGGMTHSVHSTVVGELADVLRSNLSENRYKIPKEIDEKAERSKGYFARAVEAVVESCVTGYRSLVTAAAVVAAGVLVAGNLPMHSYSRQITAPSQITQHTPAAQSEEVYFSTASAELTLVEKPPVETLPEKIANTFYVSRTDIKEGEPEKPSRELCVDYVNGLVYGGHQVRLAMLQKEPITVRGRTVFLSKACIGMYLR